MEYIVLLIVLFFLMLMYFRIADRYNIIDKPNHRSAHTEITLRGGGVVYFFGFLIFLVSLIWSKNISAQNFIIFGPGFLIIAGISFLDDLIDLSSKIRLFFHFVSVSFLLYFVSAFQLLPLWIIPILYLLVIGILNAYNFMDGINGMTGLYSLVVLWTLWFINSSIINFTIDNFILYPILATVVFLFFNFRKKAKCFMGDVGSMGIAFWILALLGLLMMSTKELKYILFLSVYGIEVIYTIIERLRLKENIFQAHRRHLYQLLVNEKRISHLWVSTFYATIQLIINILVIKLNFSDGLIFLIIVLPTSIIYLLIKSFIKNQIPSVNL